MFRFKKFRIHQDQCAMKVGTDGVLLGAWAPCHSNINQVLDIGSGTGLISLMLAQRTALFLNPPAILGVELDEKAIKQSRENIKSSPFSERIAIKNIDFTNLNQVNELGQNHPFDLIVSNPPFFKGGQKTKNNQRNLARFESALPFEALLKHTQLLLSNHGTAHFILPSLEMEEMVNVAQKVGLTNTHVLKIYGHQEAKLKRVILSFEKTDSSARKLLPKEETLVIEEARHQYTEDFERLVKEFYL